MRVAVVGGKLQGVEATYLAHKAGWEVILIDKDSKVPAAGLCDIFYQLDITTETSGLSSVIKTVDLVIPALEDTVALERLRKSTAREDIPLAYDAAAYAVSSSKKKSNALFAELGIQMPQSWPECNFPLVVKPSASSGSKGVRKIRNREGLTTFLQKAGSKLDNWVIQEFLEGPSYSLEVIGFNGNCVVFQPTEIEVDSHYDSKRVFAPAGLSQTADKQFREITMKIAKALNLIGIMDVEAVLHNGTFRVLEIDARLPSQTPTVVNKSKGVNMLTFLYEVFVRCSAPAIPEIDYEKGVIYEHIKVSQGVLEVLGEHIMTEAGPLRYYEDFFGADEALTNFAPGCSSWVAILIITGDSREEAWGRRCEVIKDIGDFFGLSVYHDSAPAKSAPNVVSSGSFL